MEDMKVKVKFPVLSKHTNRIFFKAAFVMNDPCHGFTPLNPTKWIHNNEGQKVMHHAKFKVTTIETPKQEKASHKDRKHRKVWFPHNSAQTGGKSLQ